MRKIIYYCTGGVRRICGKSVAEALSEKGDFCVADVFTF